MCNESGSDCIEADNPNDYVNYKIGKWTYYSNTNYNTSTGYITDYKEYYYNTSSDLTNRDTYKYDTNAMYKEYFYYGNDA